MWATVSVLALGAATLAPQAAAAAAFTAGDEASLKTAIQNANASADPSSTITLTGSFAIIDPAALPAATKPIDIATAGFNFTGAAFNSSTNFNVTGTGQVRLSGTSAVSGYVAATDATLRLEGGGKLTTTGATYAQQTADIVVDGAGSVLTTNELLVSDQAGSTAAVTIQNGGRVRVTQVDGLPHTIIGFGANSRGALTVTGTGSRLDIDGRLTIASSTTTTSGELIVSNRGAVSVGDFAQIAGLAAVVPATPSRLVVTGAGSTFDANALRFYKGDMEVLDGGHVTLASFQIGATGADADLLISGPGSTVSVTNQVQLTINSAGAAATGAITLSDGGVLNAGSFTSAVGANRTAIINIGGAEGAAAAAPGTLNVASLPLGNRARLNFNHTSTNYSFATPLSGAGAINQVAGVTHLTGTSSAYTGVTTVSGGELQVDGTLGGATSSVAVNGGGVLGGSGTIGGNVAVAGGVLAPGNSPGTLTIAGNLTLAPASLLDFEFGLSNVVGGPMNDLVKVGGDLTLDGAIDVTVTAGGVFDAGLYRVISYDPAKTFTDNGLTIGATPPGSTVSVQTAIPGQVNLINTAGLPVNFWDGDGAGNSGNGVVNGGAGAWTAASPNWTTATGAVNTAYTPGSFVIFAAAPGAVSLDNSAGALQVGGMQFAVNGYGLSGDRLMLAGGASTIRVGDGTADGVNYVATISSELTGGAELVKTDLGTLVLSAANTYSGGTRVSAGKLLINGDQSATVGNYTVDATGILGGTGRLGGDVTVNGTLAPGGLAGPGTLTINGDLALAAASRLNYRLGAAGTVGGALNDLLVVGGDLTLNGTLNVTQSAGGTFGPGIYRLIDYTGALTDNGLNIGSLPAGFTSTVQTSIGGQINLLAAAAPPGGGGGGGGDPPPPPPMFNFWDGAGGAADGAVSGGDGTWRATPTNWTTSTGAVEGAFTAASFAIFAAAPGAVTVDASEGPIRVSGMQFASGGYRLTGDAVALEAGEAIVRVGDGTSAGEAFTAVIAAELAGAGQLHKTDAGTLVLTGANSYSGGTAISGGVLQLGDGGASGSIAGDVVVDGVLRFNRADEARFGGAVSGGGTIIQTGAGTTLLTADSSAFAGRTQVQAGTLAVDGALGGRVEVLSGGRLTGTGQVGALANSGIVAPGHGVGSLTVAGDYAGAGGVLEMEAELGGDASQADRLVVRGATSGATLVEVKRLGGAGAVTAGGILLVQVDGASDGAFALAKGDYRLGGENALVAGAYAYVLRKDAQGGDWRLRSNVSSLAGEPSPADPSQPGLPGEPITGRPVVTLYQPGAPIYEAYPRALAALNAIGTLRQRTGARQWSGEEGASVWGRLEGGHTRLEPRLSTTQARLEIDRWKMQFGVDLPLAEAVVGGQLVGGLTAHYVEASTDVDSPFGRGDIDTKGYGLGANLTWMTTGGAYVDAQAQASWFDSDLSSTALGERTNGADGEGFAASIEAGKAIAAGGAFSLTPQAQLTYAKVDFDGFTDSFGAKVSADQGDSLLARLGLGLDHGWTGAESEGRVYGLVNLSHEFLDGSRVDVAGARLANRAEQTWGGLAAGVSYGWGAGRFLVYGEASADTALSGFGDSYTAGGSAGFRMRF